MSRGPYGEAPVTVRPGPCWRVAARPPPTPARPFADDQLPPLIAGEGFGRRHRTPATRAAYCGHDGSMRRLALLLAGALLLIAAPTASAAVSVTRAELNGGQVRVEGRGATPGA